MESGQLFPKGAKVEQNFAGSAFVNFLAEFPWQTLAPPFG